MKARTRNRYDVVQLTRELKEETNQKTVRKLFKDVTSVEVRSSGLMVSTRKTRYDIPIGSWILRNQREEVSIVSDIYFRLNYELINE